MIVTAWNNGPHFPSGAGYGVKVGYDDRSRYFRREWKSVFVLLEGQSQPIEINVAKKSFWAKTCGELISSEIGRWLIKNGMQTWQKYKAPKLVLEPMADSIDGNRFYLHK